MEHLSEVAKGTLIDVVCTQGGDILFMSSRGDAISDGALMSDKLERVIRQTAEKVIKVTYGE